MRRVAVAAALLLTSCQFGTRHQRFAPARSSHGAAITLFSDQRTQVRGELLEVGDSSLLILLATDRYAVAPYPRVRQATLHGLDPTYVYWRGMRNEPAWRARARLVARYPQGLTSDQRMRLLATANQVAPDTVP